MNRRGFLLLGAAATGAAALTACSGGGDSGSSSHSLRMAQYGSASRMALFEELFTAYAARNEGVSLSLDASSVDAYTDKLATQVAGGNAPDIMGLHPQVIAQFARQNALLELDQFFDDTLDVSTFSDGIVDLGRVEGAVRGLSFGDNAHGSIYDVGLLESLGMALPEPGYSWEDFLTFSADITRGVDGDFYGTEDRSSQPDQIFKVWLLQRGKYLFTETGELGFEKADLTDWIELWQMLRDEGAAPPADVTAEASGTFESSALIRGYAANHQTYANALASMQALTDSTLQLTTLPIASDGVGSGHFIRGSNWVGLFERSSNPEEAAGFLDFAFNDPEGAGILGAEMGAPPNRELRDQLEYSEPEQNFVDYVTLVADELGDPAITLSQEFPPSWADFNSAFGLAIEEHRFGRAGVSEVVDQFFATAEAAVEASA